MVCAKVLLLLRITIMTNTTHDAGMSDRTKGDTTMDVDHKAAPKKFLNIKMLFKPTTPIPKDFKPSPL